MCQCLHFVIDSNLLFQRFVQLSLVLQCYRLELLEELCICLLTITQQQHLTELQGPVQELLHNEPRDVMQHLLRDPDNPRIAAFLVAYVGGVVRSVWNEGNSVMYLQTVSTYLDILFCHCCMVRIIILL